MIHTPFLTHAARLSPRGRTVLLHVCHRYAAWRAEDVNRWQYAAEHGTRYTAASPPRFCDWNSMGAKSGSTRKRLLEAAEELVSVGLLEAIGREHFDAVPTADGILLAQAAIDQSSDGSSLRKR